MSSKERFLSLINDPPVIAPSMLKCDFGNLEQELLRLEEAGAQTVQWDVMDGNFVPNLSYGAMVIAKLRKKTRLFFDAHLMIADPGKYLPDYVKAGCDLVTFHLEAVPDPGPLLQYLKDQGVLCGLAINPATPAEQLDPWIPQLDLVLVMSVNPGFGGQEFMPQVLNKVSVLTQGLSPDQILAIDGGIGLDTISQASAAGARYFVVGSAIFDETDYISAISGLRTQAGRP